MAQLGVATEQQLVELNEFLAKNNYVNGDFPAVDDVRIFNALKGAPPKDKFPEVYFWYYLIQSFTPAVREQWAGAPKQEAPKKQDIKKPEAPKPAAPAEDDDDLFGDDNQTEEQKAAAAAAAAELAAKKKADALKAAAPKKKVIAKTIVMFDVKVYEATDMELLERIAKKVITEIQLDGLVWGKEIKYPEVAYGAKKIALSMIIEDDKIATDDVFDTILSWEDDVQSVDVVTMQKV